MSTLPESITQERTRWFREARFGMFIHWGLYAQAAGMWDGKKYFGIGEWMMQRAQVSVCEYEKLASEFNPIKFDANQWVSIAVAAGMKYIVITAKHHDGFAMFNSEASSFNIVNATDFKRDPMQELAVACEKAGIKLCFYYSQWQDWHEPGGAGNNWEFPNSEERFAEYFETKCKPQIRELLTNYGPVGLLWFDTPGTMTPEQSTQLVELVHTLQPECLVSSRVGNDAGDFLDLGDHELPSEVINEPWEALFTHNDSWGYVQFDKNWRSTRELVRMLLRVNGKNGNFLLNVGPQSDGLLPEASVQVLQRVGAWVHTNAEAIHGSTHSPFAELAWGECTAKPGALYLHVLTWPEDRILRVPGVCADVQEICLLHDRAELGWRREEQDILITLPDRMPDPIATTIKLAYTGELQVAPERTIMPDLINILTPVEACLSGQAAAGKHSWMEEFGDWKHLHAIEGWQTPEDAAQWTFRVPAPGQYRVALTYSRTGPAGRVACLTTADQLLWIEAQNTGCETKHLFTHTIGVLTFEQAGLQILRLAPESSGDELFKLEKIILEPFA